MDLDDLPAIPGFRGRRPREVIAEVVRPLEESDLALLEVERGTRPPNIKQLRDSHHALARVLASGAHPAEASLVTGYSLSRISILQSDPTFRELLEFYRTAKDEIFADVMGRMSALQLEAMSALLERMHDNPEQFSPAMLVEVAKTFADRTGYGPSSKSTNVNLNLDIATKLERARQRVIEHLETPPEEPGA